MTSAEKCLELVAELPSDYTEGVIAKLRSGDAAFNFPNPHYRGRIEEFLHDIESSEPETAAMLEMALCARSRRPSIDLVWTGPTVSTLPVRHTEQVLLDIIRDAHHSLTILSFGLFQVPRVLAQLERAVNRGVQVRIVLGEKEEQLEAAQSQQKRQLGDVILRGAQVYHWPPQRRLRDDLGRSGLMHMKAVIADTGVLFISSANLTGDGLERNMELGLLVKGGNVPSQADKQVDALIAAAWLVPTLVC